MKIWITKYALTVGILVREARIGVSREMAIYVDGRQTVLSISLIGTDQKKEALFHAEEMRFKKLGSLERQIAKMSNLQIKIKEQDQ